MSPLMKEWREFATETSEAVATDRFFAVEMKDPRVSFDRRVVVGAVSDSRPDKRGVLLVAITSDDQRQELGVSAREQANAIVDAFLDAWPDLLENHAYPFLTHERYP